MYHVLIVDDEKEIIDLLRLYLEQDEVKIYEAYDGEMGYEVFKKYEIDLALVDIMMPRMNGYELVKKVQRLIPGGKEIPIMFLTARGELQDRILGLDLGADDYITKPFEPLEVAARVRARLRRRKNMQTPDKLAHELRVGDIILSLEECQITLGEEVTTLTKVEYLVLKMFMENPGRVFTKEQIYETGWEDSYVVDDNTIRVIISRLRDKVGEDRIKTIRGLGYRMEKG
ncbi:response regulator transcription factor [Anaeromicropila herbilytica]|uniref:Stage 0 sporulation protein A homolog n=1 Tax=Anaeromicropila herbilytica TaxID=2785025 RepID=A0A7R7EPI0_9FIRM|nr:response regulator transcription factor [Anaeromicropila herbilytica]BCN32685.1 DNA-binding response regulator [Anaeromicropila herbilytica]